MLYLALSCLQGREILPAAQELIELEIDGLQLTPGNFPSDGFKECLAEQKIMARTHHGFNWQGIRQRVWNAELDCLVKADSVHPPHIKSNQNQAETERIWQRKAEQGNYQNILLETMYSGYFLGSDRQILWAMEIGLNLAVDVSHIYIQICQGTLNLSTWQKLQEYSNIGEFHLSANNGNGDIHQPLIESTFGLDWVRDRSQSNPEIPIILECYMHSLTFTQRQQQVKFLKE
ncbi:hypothetical protein [Pseudanabaena sp. PCC 6802]|uniref:hypothetical protein n=1 Tax=Pseudanabaena sp. PCC 6802 TaxID=118173 RepID=UPI000346ADA0|nr:hypothetical protein [Pseudanabaena sp. PCC 6802]